MAVLIYHFSPEVLSGGFVGVDIFFVISGYLMTKIISDKINAQSFSFIEFYSARCVRIIPPLVFLCFALMLFGYFYLSIFDFRNLNKHIFSSGLFISNINYYMETGYFDVSSNYKWLLHTWSLSVEWQFYILFPVYMLVINYLLPSRYLKCFYIFTLAALFIYGMYLSNINQSLGFFSLQSRGWELMLGGVAHLYPIKTQSEKIKKTLAYVGYFLLIISIITLTSGYGWPSFYTLVPALATFIIILASTNMPFDKSEIVQAIGTRSYSIYLWHWPIKTAFFYCSLTSPLYDVLGGAGAIIVGSFAYSLIEKNSKGKFSQLTLKRVFFFKPLWCVVLLTVASSYIYFKNGLSERRVPSLLNIQKSPFHTECDKKNCNYFYPNPSWAVLGDSHAKEIAYSLAKELAKTKNSLIEYSYAGCKPSFELKETNGCMAWTEKSVSEIVNNEKIKNIVISYRTILFEDDDNSFESFDKIIKTLSKTNANIYILMPIPSSDSKVNSIAFRHNFINDNSVSSISITLENYNKNNSRVISYLNKIQDKKIKLIDTKSYFCDLTHCYSIKGGIPLYFDDNHPSINITDKIIKTLLLQ